MVWLDHVINYWLLYYCIFSYIINRFFCPLYFLGMGRGLNIRPQDLFWAYIFDKNFHSIAYHRCLKVAKGKYVPPLGNETSVRS